MRRSTPRAAILVALVALSGPLLAACGDDDESGSPTMSSTEGDRGDAGVTLADDSLRVITVTDDLDQPTSMAFSPDGLLVTEKATGHVRLVSDASPTRTVLDLAVNSFDERGLLGIAVHPEFDTEPFVYLHWTWRGAGDGDQGLLGDDSDEATAVPALGNRVDRFRWDGSVLVFDRNIVQLPSATLDTDTSDRVRGNHDAGPLVFGPDGKLYVMLGDQNLRGQLQNIPDGPAPDDAHLAGMILRLNDDGTVPEDNPFTGAAERFEGEVRDNLRMLYAYGVRNSFGLAFHPESGVLWQTENGDDAFDEINVLAGGANSGWIQLQGPRERFEEFRELERGSEDGFDTPTYGPERLAADADAATAALWSLPGSHLSEPVLSYVHPPALTAIAFVPDDRMGATSRDTLWVGTVLTDSLLRYEVAPDGRRLDLDGDLSDRVDDNAAKGDLGESDGNVVGTGFGVITDIDQGPNGYVYVLSMDAGAIYRIFPAAGG